MKTLLAAVALALAFAFLIAFNEQNQDISSKTENADDFAKFNGIKEEIDYWYGQGPGKIGQEHKEKLLQRLSELVVVPAGEIEQYREKLDAIVLAPSPGQAQWENSAPQQERWGCEGTGTAKFTSAPMRLDDIEIIEPVGLMIGGHVTPIDHGYYYAKSWTPRREDASSFVEVLAPAPGIIAELSSMPAEFASSKFGDYRFELQHTCSFKTIYIHVNQLSEKLQKALQTRQPVRVEAGEVLGKAPGFDFSVHDSDATLEGFVVPEHYEIEPWKVHTADMFEYFAEPVKSQLLAKNVRQKEPRGGKIDYDIDGKLVGNWFEVGTSWYEGKKEYNRGTGYWSTHLAFAYDGIVPDTIVVSMGDFDGKAVQFGVKGNAPDPADVDAADGLVKYELVQYDYYADDGKPWDRVHFAKVTSTKPSSPADGVALVQVLENRKIKFEAFAGKTAAQVSGFTPNAKVYER
ncbi:MAG: hypothetical protein HY519_01955 [Candidatus Aenigmarchaeota archaeon]|nr:hypothetical protein [Candidatus Aenigmarchaeota archaeon]